MLKRLHISVLVTPTRIFTFSWFIFKGNPDLTCSSPCFLERQLLQWASACKICAFSLWIDRHGWPSFALWSRAERAVIIECTQDGFFYSWLDSLFHNISYLHFFAAFMFWIVTGITTGVNCWHLQCKLIMIASLGWFMGTDEITPLESGVLNFLLHFFYRKLLYSYSSSLSYCYLLSFHWVEPQHNINFFMYALSVIHSCYSKGFYLVNHALFHSAFCCRIKLLIVFLSSIYISLVSML